MSRIIKSIILTNLPAREYSQAFTVSSRLLFTATPAVLLLVLTLAVISASAAPVATTRTIAVDDIDDNNPTAGCTLREAIDVANAGLGAGTAINGCTVVEGGTGTPISYEINLPSYTYTLSGAAGNNDNTSGDLDILANMVIRGTGANSTIIDGASIDRVFHLPIAGLGVTLHLSNMTIQNGYVPYYEYGGGIYNNGNTLIVSNSTIADNTSSWHGGGINTSSGKTSIISCTISNNFARYGGGINNDTLSYPDGISPTLNINNTTIANNIAPGSLGGGIGVTGGSITQTVNIANTTISGNLANAGGGIYIDEFLGSTSLINVTIFNNTADHNGGGILNHNDNLDTVSLKNSIVAGNSALSGENHDCSGSFISLQHNLIGKNMGCIFSFPVGLPNVNNDFVGTGALPVDPILGPLAYNGGDTQTHALLPGSPAIDAIPVVSCTLTTDQRGVARPCNTACDIGAYERIPDPIFVLTKKANDDRPLPGQVITYTISLENRGYFTATNGFISDTLPAGLSLAGPVILEPPEAGNVGIYPILANNLTIIVGQRITVTFPATIQTDVAGVITNTAVFSSTELIAPQASSKTIIVGYHIYLPLVSRNYSDLVMKDTPILIRLEQRNEAMSKAGRHQ